MDNRIIPGLVFIEKKTGSVYKVTGKNNYNYFTETCSKHSRTIGCGELPNFDKDLNIKSNISGIAGKLSNLTPFDFTLDGINFSSMEGFLQALKFKSQNTKKEIWQMSGKQAKKRGATKNSFWVKTGKLYYQGKEVDRHEREYQVLLNRAYDALFENADFQNALRETKGYRLIHKIGVTNPYKTILTEVEFIYQLMRLRDKL